MLVYLALTAAVIAIAMLIKKRELNTGYGNNFCIHRGMTRQDMVNIIAISAIFLGLFMVSALRVNVGNDYSNLVEYMHLVFSRTKYYAPMVPTEVGFNAVSYVIYYLCGFENFILVFAIFAFFTLLFFLKGMWEQSECFFISFVMYILLGYYFQSFSTVRYYLVLGIALYSIKYVINKDWPRFVLAVILGALFHKSLLVLLVFYPLARLPWKRWMCGVGALFCLSTVFLRDFYLNEILLRLYPTYKDTSYLEDIKVGYISIIRCLAVLIFSIWILRGRYRENKTYLFFFHCNLLALALLLFGSFIPLNDRIGHYLMVTHILFVPALIMNIKGDKRRGLVKALVIVACLMYFAIYMWRDAPRDGVRILPYRTILFHDMPLTLSERGFY